MIGLLNTSRDQIIPLPKLKNILEITPNFQNCVRCKKDLKDNKHNSLHRVPKWWRHKNNFFEIMGYDVTFL